MMRCAVLGDPIDHSLSPVLHRAGYAAVGVPELSDWEYDARRVKSGHLPVFLDTLDASWRGLSLTMPLKREAMALVGDRISSVSHRARTAGAVNTLVRTSYGWAGDNTDLPGSVNAIRERHEGDLRRAVILGAGATAASTGLALASLGVTDITLLARDADRAAETARVLSEAGAEVLVQPLELRVDLGESGILVSTVPVEAQTDSLVRRWSQAPVLFDVVYDPWPTPLVAALREAGRTVITGLDLLVHQAALQFGLFTSQAAPLEAMREAGEAALRERAGTSG